MPEKIIVHVELSDDFLESVMVTMVESGYYCIDYWGHVTDIKRKPNLNVTSFRAHDDESGDVKHIDGKAVATAIQGLLAGTIKVGSVVHGYIYRAVLENDPGDIDADAADCIVQAALFGEMVYG